MDRFVRKVWSGLQIEKIDKLLLLLLLLSCMPEDACNKLLSETRSCAVAKRMKIGFEVRVDRKSEPHHSRGCGNILQKEK